MSTAPHAALPALPDFAADLGHGIYAVDTGFQRPLFDAAYLMVQDGRAAFIDSGTNHAVPRLLATLEALGLGRDCVDWIIPTHVHLDHAGGVGALAHELPTARVLVHPRGARHLIDPSALWQGAMAVYGPEEMARSYGTLLPVPADRVLSSTDGMVVSLAGRELMLVHTAGHARHHHCIWDATSQGWFTGDTFGLSYRDFDTAAGAWIMPTTTPVQFEPEALQDSIQRLLAREPRCMYLTHYGRVDDVPRMGALLLDLLQQLVTLGRSAPTGAQRHEALKQGQLKLLGDSLRRHGCSFSPERIAELLAIDVELNAQGMAVWLDRG